MVTMIILTVLVFLLVLDIRKRNKLIDLQQAQFFKVKGEMEKLREKWKVISLEEQEQKEAEFLNKLGDRLELSGLAVSAQFLITKLHKRFKNSKSKKEEIEEVREILKQIRVRIMYMESDLIMGTPTQPDIQTKEVDESGCRKPNN